MLKRNGFSLLEALTVMLITSIVLAAATPLITKRFSSGNSEIAQVFKRVNNTTVQYIAGGNQEFHLGTEARQFVGIVPKKGDTPFESVVFGYFKPTKLIANPNIDAPTGKFVSLGFDTQVGANSIAIGNSSTAGAGGLYKESDNGYLMGGNGFTYLEKLGAPAGLNKNIAYKSKGYSVAIGDNAKANDFGAIAIGAYAKTKLQGSEPGIGSDAGIALGYGSICDNDIATAIGFTANASGYASTAIGPKAVAKGITSTAIGPKASTSNASMHSLALGYNAQAGNHNAVAIGINAQADIENTIVLGTEQDTVIIPGNLIVRGTIYYNGSSGSTGGSGGGSGGGTGGGSPFDIPEDAKFSPALENKYPDLKPVVAPDVGRPSDRRLKNIGENYTASLSELEKLSFYHYTYKNDKNNTPQVGVIAQDLQKVFPNAVTKGDDGYLRIRWDEMFYAALNSIKELNTNLCAIIEDMKTVKDNIAKVIVKYDKQQETIKILQNKIEEQEKTIRKQQNDYDGLLKRIEKLEREIKK